ncbi:hypothetical protein [Sinorhizobium medicae]
MGILAEALKDSGLLDTDRPIVAEQQGGGWYYYMPMPVDEDGNGPASEDETASIIHEVWGQESLTVCVCGNEAMARFVASALNASGMFPTY